MPRFQKRRPWVRHHPTARAIAQYLTPALLTLPRWMVIADIRQRFHVGDCTARTAVAIARRNP